MRRRESSGQRRAFRIGALLPAAGVALVFAWVAAHDGPAAVRDLVGHGVLSLLVIGKFVVFLGLADDAPLGPVGFALLVWFVDVFWAFLLVGGLSHAHSLPLVGTQLTRARLRASELIESYPRLESMAFWGVAVLVFLPIAATGAITGSFAAQLVGLPRLLGVGAVALGSAVTSAVFAGLALAAGSRAETVLRSPVLAAASLVVLLLLARAAYVRIERLLRTAPPRRRPRGAAPAPPDGPEAPAP